MLFLGLVLLVKPIASAITIGAGGSGGIFAPSLFAGAIAGFLFSYVLNYLGWLPVSLPVAHFTLVAMCGLMSGVQHAPLSAIFLIAELTGGYALFLPLMLVSAISFLTTTYFDKASLYKQQLQDTGRYIPESTDEELLDQIDLRKITEKDLLPTEPEASLAELCELVKKSKRNIFPVLGADGALVGIVTLDDIRTIMFDPVKQHQLRVKNLMHSPPDFIFLGENMQIVMGKFERSGAWNLPVLADGKYLGFISKSRIFNAYRKRLIKQNQD
ncbi:cl- channel voltage-gated family protein [Nitritalea halalkaliphila LW7]|uniref:Cl-channel voltage-gated family protein n=1 Tax=Nitritalea halalkaliphila LW7 TaxID=1189621 RepID=I5C785_9BACT|nr:chloride channel protein [Nitritalea halalkaliphila]EIM77687.1 cl- channel voltage-gated family protein [Nitritalea halalkaliphila LW7]